MQVLQAHDYGYLAELATSYRDVSLSALKKEAHYNPRLSVDALCFQYSDLRISGASTLVGALITPCALWMLVVPEQAMLPAPLEESHVVSLPSGRYRMTLERLPNGIEFYQRCILDDLSELESLQEASRLAQRMMEQLMSSATL
ncbi:MAG: [NiFe]-hydrogenase assembly chaperone HybE [Halomonas sp.]|nr:[NiFe]-hydrogenase assembly chaperone HybE [Halomonas sp.]MDM7483158.1 [NiFe]-hydrogenase assembly chaperone HybE [Halomonas sp.]